jgi:hypothetical protein
MIVMRIVVLAAVAVRSCHLSPQLLKLLQHSVATAMNYVGNTVNYYSSNSLPAPQELFYILTQL